MVEYLSKDIERKYDGIPDRAIIISTAEKLDAHLADHKLLKVSIRNRFWTFFGLTVTALATAVFEFFLHH